MVWTQFWDMHSGGRTKEAPYDRIYIEAPRDEAEVIFYNRFGHNPNAIGCSCCGENYDINSEETLEQLTGYHRSCAYDDKSRKYLETVYTGEYAFGTYKTLDEYLEESYVLSIRADEIEDSERAGELPQSGWVWMG